MPYTKSQIDKMYAELPDDVKEAMTSVETVDILKEIQEKYHFHIDQVGNLSAEIGMLMLGATPPQRFISSVQKTLEVSPEIAKEIATTVNERIFKKIRHSLMELHEMSVESAPVAEKPQEIKSAVMEIKTETDKTKKPAIDPYKEVV